MTAKKEKIIKALKYDKALFNRYKRFYCKKKKGRFALDLRGVDLSGVDLSGADLSGTNLREADLRGVDLSGVDLSEVNLSGSDLSGSDLSGVDISGVDLSRVDLSRVDFSGADFRDTDLRGSDISHSSGIPLHCGGQKAKIDEKQAMQIVAHAFAQQCNSKEYNDLKEAARDFCKKSHIAKYLNWLQMEK